MKWWNELVADNPMMIESKLFVRKFFGPHALASGLALGAIAILLALLTGMMYVYEISYRGPALAALAVLTVLVPILLHGSIAGERERGSWEMLMVAPLTSAQIVMGKFIGALNSILIVTGAFGVAVLFANYPREDLVTTGPIVILLILSFGICLAGYSLLISALSHRSMAALGTVYGTLFLLLLALPNIIMAVDHTAEEPTMYLNPYYAVLQMREERYPGPYGQDAYSYASYDSPMAPEGDVDLNSYLLYGGMHIFLYLSIAGLCLWLAAGAVHSRGVESRHRRVKENA